MDQLITPQLIFFFILITCLLDIKLILYGEILSRSLLQDKGLTQSSYRENLRPTDWVKPWSQSDLV